MAETITPNQFSQHVLEENQPVVVDFYADWCGPCKEYVNTFESVAEQHDDVKFVKVNIGEDPQLAMQYGIRSVPTTGTFKNGELVEVQSGSLSESSLSQLTESLRVA